MNWTTQVDALATAAVQRDANATWDNVAPEFAQVLAQYRDMLGGSEDVTLFCAKRVIKRTWDAPYLNKVCVCVWWCMVLPLLANSVFNHYRDADVHASRCRPLTPQRSSAYQQLACFWRCCFPNNCVCPLLACLPLPLSL